MNENRFIEKFQKKTDSELKFILENRKKYNEKAVAAAIYIINERNGKSPEIETIENIIKIEKSKKKEKIAPQKHIKKNENKWHKNYYARQLLWFGIACIGSAFYFIAPTLFTMKRSLIETNGKIVIVETVYTKVSSSRGHKSVKSELILILENDNRIYRLVKNIEQSWNNKKYELIEKELKKSGKAIVWIKGNQQSKKEPVVFQIATGENNVLYDMNDVKSELKFLFPFLLIIGFFGIGVYINHKYPNSIKNLIK
jgi:hypothetical protein